MTIHASRPKKMDTTPILQVRDLSMKFGGLTALDRLNLEVGKGDIVAVIGPNGAGKTTFFNCLTGMYPFSDGDIVILPRGDKRQSLRGLKPNQITSLGLARTFQNIRLFPSMTVLENVMIGRHCRTCSGIFGAIFRPRATRAEEKEVLESSRELLAKVDLLEYADELAKNLAYGLQRRLELARALATEPFLLLLDEPAAGLNTQETRELDQLLLKIRAEQNLSILLIEHDMKLVMSLSDHIVVMDYGRKIAEGNREEIRHNPVVIEAYLGEQHE